MDINALHHCFQATLSADPNERKRAELELYKAEVSPGFIGGCLDIVSEHQVDLAVKQAAALYLKNKVCRYWAPLDKETPKRIPESEKPQFRERLVPALVKADPKIRTALVSTLEGVVSKDLPEGWPELIDITMNLIQSNDLQYIRAGLTCLLEIARFYRWTTGDIRKFFDQIVERALPVALNIGNQLVNEESSEAAWMLRDIIKIYKMSTYHMFPLCLRTQESVVAWGTLFLTTIKKPLPAAVLKLDEDERELNGWTKAKKWSYANLYRLLYRYAQPDAVSKATHEHHQFAVMYIEHFVPEILNLYFEQIDLWVNKQIWIGSACMDKLLNFFDRCVTVKETWKLIKPHVETLISHVIFPLVCPSDNELEMFEDDPDEYIRRRIDYLEEGASADIAACNFLLTLVRTRNKASFSPMLLFVQGVLDRQLSDPDNIERCKEKEGALRMLSTSAVTVMNKKSPIKDKMESFIVQYVFPDFNSKYHFLRARACEFLNQYHNVEYQNVENISFIYQHVLKCMSDEYLPVQIEASLALQPLIQHVAVREALTTRIPEVMQQLLDLGKRVDIDAISGIMEEFVEVFSEQLAPFAERLAEQLRDQFLVIGNDLYEKQSVPADEIDYDSFMNEDKTIAACGILTTLSSLIISLDSSPEIVANIETVMMPILSFIIEKDMSEFYTEAFGIIENCVFCLKAVSPNMWHIFKLSRQVFSGIGMDYLDDIMPSLDEIIQFGASDMIQNEELTSIMFDVVRLGFLNADAGASERTLVAALAQKMLVALKGHMDQFVEPLLQLVVARLSGDGAKLKNVAYHIHLLEVVVASLYYNATATIQFLESKDFTAHFFSSWFNQMNHFTRVQDKKISALGIMAVLSLPISTIPQSLQGNLPQLAKGLVTIMGSLPAAIEQKEKQARTFHEDDYDFDDGFEDGYDAQDFDDDDEEDATEENHASAEYLNFLEESASKINAGGGVHFEDEDDEELEEEPLMASPLDNINTYIAFRDTFQALSSTDAARYQLLTTNFTNQEMTIVQETIALANATPVAGQ